MIIYQMGQGVKWGMCRIIAKATSKKEAGKSKKEEDEEEEGE